MGSCTSVKRYVGCIRLSAQVEITNQLIFDLSTIIYSNFLIAKRQGIVHSTLCSSRRRDLSAKQI